MRHLIIVIYTLVALLPLTAKPQGNVDMQCPAVKVQAERLPDLNVPRCGHSLLSINGELTVIGGHTSNFVPTATIEYYKEGKWHLVPSAFTHDDGFAVQLSEGKVLLGGGHERNLGIGQSYEVELYDPQTHTCEGFGSLDTKRALANAISLEGNRAIISGNWYHDDAIELYDGKSSFIPLKVTSCGRATPYILRTGKDDAIIFTGIDSKGQHTSHPVIDRLRGEAYRESLLEEWGLHKRYVKNPSSAFIGDESKGDYSYLLMVENEQGQVAIVRVTNGEFSLLPTAIPVPMTCQWGRIDYVSQIYADRQSQRAYLLGTDPDKWCQPPKLESARIYILTIDYATTPARLTLGYTDVISDVDIDHALMTEDGDLMVAGGIPTQNNFKPTVATWLLHVSPRAQKAGIGQVIGRIPLWIWVLAALSVIMLAAMLIGLSRRRKRNPVIVSGEKPVTGHEITLEEETGSGENDAELMQRICQVMEEQQPYLNPNLKVADVATALGSNRTIISNCINSQRGCSFPQFVNTYRVAHAQALLRRQPDLKMADVYLASGFSSEASFYRIFKVITGTTPTDWRQDNKTKI